MFRLRTNEDNAGSFLGLRRVHGSVQEEIDLVLFGVPSNVGAEGRAEVAQAPAAVRKSSWNFGAYNHALGVDILELLSASDGGDIGGDLAREELLNAIAEQTETLARGGQVPGFIGGSALVTLGALRGLKRAKRRGVSLLHISAKHRCRVDDLSEAGSLAMAQAEALLRPSSVLQVGVRGPSRDAAESQRALSFGFERMTTDDVRWEIHAVMDSIRARAVQGPMYLSVDVSAFDPSVCPGQCRPSAGGLSSWEVQQLLRALIGAEIVGFDVVGLCPSADVSELSSTLVVSVLHEVLAVIAEGRDASRISWEPGSVGRTSA